VRMHTIFYSFICLPLALKVQAENFICRDKWDHEVFLQLVESGSYFELDQRNYTNVPDAFYEKNPEVKVYYGANRDFVATKFELERKKGVGVTYTSVGLDTPVVLTSKMWDVMCKPPVAQYNCESPTSIGDFLKIEKRKYKIKQERRRSVIVLNGKSERSWTKTRFYKNESDGSFYFESYEKSDEPSLEEPYYLWGKKTWMTAVFYKNRSNGSYYFENPVNPNFEYPGHPENPDNPNLVFTKEMVNEMCRMVAA